MLEAVLAVVILGVVGFALHSATLSGMRYMQMGKARAAQAKQLEYVIDWVRADACYWKDKVTAGTQREFTLFDGTIAIVRLLNKQSGDPPALRSVEVELPATVYVSAISQPLLLDLGMCD